MEAYEAAQRSYKATVEMTLGRGRLYQDQINKAHAKLVDAYDALPAAEKANMPVPDRRPYEGFDDISIAAMVAIGRQAGNAIFHERWQQ